MTVTIAYTATIIAGDVNERINEHMQIITKNDLHRQLSNYYGTSPCMQQSDATKQ